MLRWRDREWTARGGFAALTTDDCLRFVEDAAEGLHGLVLVLPPTNQAGLGLRLRIRQARRAQLAVWVGPLGSGETASISVDLESGKAVAPRTGPLDVALATPESGVCDLWVALQEPATASGYRVDIVARATAEGASQYRGEGRRAILLEDFELVDPNGALLTQVAMMHAFEAEAKFAEVGEYYRAFLNPEQMRAAMAKVGPEEGSSALFEALLAESAPFPTLAPADLSARWIGSANAHAFAFELTSRDLAQELKQQDGFARNLGALEICGAVEFPFASDAGASELERIAEAEQTYLCSPATAPTSIIEASPRLAAAALFAAAGFHGAGLYLRALDVARYCFDPMVLTEPYRAAPGRPMARCGRLHIRLKRLSARP